LDQVWYINVDQEVAYQRLLQRHMAGGKTELEARQKIASTDAPNARLIEKTKQFADVVLGQDEI
jgi:pantothenate kinase